MSSNDKPPRKARIFYARTDEFWRKGEKYAFLDEKQHVSKIEWQELQPDTKHTWLTEGMRSEFDHFMLLISKEAKRAKAAGEKVIFKTFSPGVNTARDSIVYGFDYNELLERVEQFGNEYNSEVLRFQAKGKPNDIDNFLRTEKIKWSEGLKRKLRSGVQAEVDSRNIREGLYRPFTKMFLYSDSLFSDRPGAFKEIFPATSSEAENKVICIPSVGGRVDYWCFCTNATPNLTIISVDINQCLPFFTYDEDGTNRRENITDWALEQFRAQYGDQSISKWDIFHYVYAVLHHPEYRERYAANLKRELPRIPFAPDFRAFADAGTRLAELHVYYERQPEYPLARIEQPGAALNLRVERMRLSKDRRSLVYNDFLTLAGIPEEVFHYRLGNRSALEWVIDQYQVTTDRRSGITNDPNRADDPQYILRLVGQVVTVSLETIKLVRALPALGLPS